MGFHIMFAVRFNETERLLPERLAHLTFEAKFLFYLASNAAALDVIADALFHLGTCFRVFLLKRGQGGSRGACFLDGRDHLTDLVTQQRDRRMEVVSTNRE